MADYISREALRDALYEQDAITMRGVAIINSVPAADVEPVRHGRWEGYTHSWYFGCDEYGEPRWRDGTVWYCSDRKCRRKTVIKEKFCPSCGSKMDLEDEK